MSAKNKKKQKGPSWFEVGFGAVLSILLGTALGALYLVSKPVTKVASLPKEPAPGAIYFIEGSRDFSRSQAVSSKRKSFVNGESISLTEGEINLALGDLGKPAPTTTQKTPAKTDDKAPAADKKPVEVGQLNARIHDGKIQFADTVSYSILGVEGTIIVQASGSINKHSSGFQFDPDEFYVGGCPMQRFLFLRSYVQSKLLFNQPMPDDIAAAWSKLSDVTIEGTSLKLKMPQS